MAIYKAGSMGLVGGAHMDQPVDKPIGAGTLVGATGIINFPKDAEQQLEDGDVLHLLEIPWGCELISGNLSATDEDEEGNVTSVPVSGTVGYEATADEEANPEAFGEVSGDKEEGGPLKGILTGGRTKEFARQTVVSVKLNGVPSFSGNGRVILSAIWRVI
jgi:hypothetical protein